MEIIKKAYITKDRPMHLVGRKLYVDSGGEIYVSKPSYLEIVSGAGKKRVRLKKGESVLVGVKDSFSFLMPREER